MVCALNGEESAAVCSRTAPAITTNCKDGIFCKDGRICACYQMPSDEMAVSGSQPKFVPCSSTILCCFQVHQLSCPAMPAGNPTFWTCMELVAGLDGQRKVSEWCPAEHRYSAMAMQLCWQGSKAGRAAALAVGHGGLASPGSLQPCPELLRLCVQCSCGSTWPVLGR